MFHPTLNEGFFFHLILCFGTKIDFFFLKMSSGFAQHIITKQMSLKIFRILNSVFWKMLCSHYCEYPRWNEPAWLLEEVSLWWCVGWLERQEARTGDRAWWSGLSLRNSSPGVLSQTFTEGLSVLQSHSCGSAQGSWGLIQDFVEINSENQVSELCSTWIACDGEAPWACLQCHPVGTGQALLVLLEVPRGKLLSLPCFSGLLLMQ